MYKLFDLYYLILTHGIKERRFVYWNLPDINMSNATIGVYLKRFAKTNFILKFAAPNDH